MKLTHDKGFGTDKLPIIPPIDHTYDPIADGLKKFVEDFELPPPTATDPCSWDTKSETFTDVDGQSRVRTVVATDCSEKLLEYKVTFDMADLTGGK